MKKTLKGYVLGVITTAIFAGTISMAANSVRIVIDNKELIPTDVNGNIVEPIIIDGTTYLPVRAVAQAFGKAVYWDGPNFTVYLGDMNGSLEYPTVEIEDMISINQRPQITNALTDNYGNRYSHAIYNELPNRHLEYLLQMKYSRFKGTLYVPQGATSDKSAYLSIIADGKTIYTSPEMTKTSASVNVDVNVKGYNDVEIVFSTDDSRLPLMLADAGFYQ